MAWLRGPLGSLGVLGSLSLLGGLLTSSLALVGAPRAAQACGGTFCDAGPQIMPVDQTGETIVFWIDEGGSEPHTEAHIQIQYEGDAERFAWIIPVMAAPEVLVGSQALFDNLLTATQPVFQTQSTTVGDCFGGMGFGCAMAREDSAGGDLNGFTTFADDGGDSDTDGPDILDRGFAGAFEYVTLTGDTVAEVVDWLDMAGYAQDDDAPPILQEYLDEGFVFVAVKLRSGVGVDEIHPLAIRYPGTEPCIPIRLTRIAAVEDMAIRAMFLGEDRVASSNWPHVILNHLALDYVNNPAASYAEAVSLAIDEAGGRAFVTEYAGTDVIVSTSDLRDPRWNPAAFAEIAAVGVVEELSDQTLMACLNDTCNFFHPQIRALLERFLPAPDGMDPEQFWSCLSCYEGLIDADAWDPTAFAAALDEQIVGPGDHAVEMLADATYLTRLYTVLSPHEMTEDPLFHVVRGVGNVDTLFDATRVNDCDGGPTVFELPDGRSVALTEGGTMPDLELPVAARIERIPAMGPAQVEVDNEPEIDAALDAYNRTRLTGPSPSCTVRRGDSGRTEGVLGVLAVFVIAGLHRRRRTRMS